MRSRGIRITAIAIAIPLCLLLCKHNLWAEPDRPEPETAFYVQIREHRAELTEELEVETLEKQMELFCKCVEAEAGNQSLLGKRLVCDVILNRVASPDFPDGIEGVINQENQFSVVANGAIDRVTVSDETRQAVIMEMNERIDTEIIYFKAGGYPKFGEPVYQVDQHYFSK